MSKAAVRAGLIFGAIVALLRVADQAAGVAVTLSFGGADPTSDPHVFAQGLFTLFLVSAVGFILFFVNLGLYLWSGTFASRATGSVVTGTIAGMTAGLVAGLAGAAVTIGVYAAGLERFTGVGTTGSDSQSPIGFAGLLIAISVFALVGVALDAGIGAGMGALGGLMGKSLYETDHPQPPVAGYPGMYPPPWAYPGYPANPAYPWSGAYPPPPLGVYPPPPGPTWPVEHPHDDPPPPPPTQ
jgi:hypothetical protein